MKMTAAYMADTADAIAKKGAFTLVKTPVQYGGSDGATGTRFALERDGGRVHLVLEALSHPDVGETYHLELKSYFGIRFTSFPLDSWKHFADRVEFKFYAMPETGLGLSFILDLKPTTEV